MVNKLNIPPKKDELIDKVNEIIDNFEDITVDSELSTTSENPVQNKVVTGALNDKQDVLTAGTDLEIVQNSILPSGYVQLKSITATGSQYINTGLWLTDNFKAEIVGRFTSTTGTQCMLGATVRTSNATYRNIVLGKNASQYYVGNGSPWYQPNQTNSSATLDTNEHTFVIEITSETTKISIDGIENTASYTSSSIEENLYLFANNAIVTGGTSSAADFARFEAESVKLYDNGSLIFNGIPASNGGQAGLYDTVSETFMPSLGSSAFVAGDEVVTQTMINFTNDSGYTKNKGTVTSVNGVQPDTNGNVAITIPTVNNGTLTITQDGNTLGTFGANQSTNSTIDIPAPDLNGKADIDGSNINQLFSTNLVANMSDTANIYMSGIGMPSDTYIDLTLGASGSTYTAPANGYIFFNKSSSGAGQYVDITNNASGLTAQQISTANYQNLPCFIECRQGDSFTVKYEAGGALQGFRFVYAQGSESEAN